MNKYEEAGHRLAHGSGPIENSTRVNRKGYFGNNCRLFGLQIQCRKCGSDFMKAALDGLCQDCLQRAEFVIRERPDIVRRINQRRAR